VRLEGRAQHLAVFGAYLALAVLATWPLARHAADHVYGLGTPPLNVWAIGWVLHQLPRDPLHLFDANAFYPYSDSLAFSEHLFVPALLASPIVAATGNLVLAHNCVAILSLALAGLGMYLLARELVGSGVGPFAAGLLYAFHTWNVNELARLQIVSNEWFPFLLLMLLRFFAQPRARTAGLVAFFYVLQSLSCMYWALYLPLLVGPALVVLQWRRRLSLRSLRPLALAFLLALALVAPFFVPYWRSAAQLGFARRPPDSVGLERYLDVRPGNIYAPWLGTAKVNQDAAHFLGFVPLALAGVALFSRKLRVEGALGRSFWIALAASGFVLSLGPQVRLGTHVLAAGPYALLYRFMPGFHNVRYPERFCLFVVLGLAPLAALGLAALQRRFGRALALTLTAALFVEHVAVPLSLAPLPTGMQVPSVYRWLATQADVHVVAELPASRYRMERLDAMPMYFSSVHWKRTLQGFTGYFPPAYGFIKWRLSQFPADESVRFLQRLGVDTLVVAPEEAALLAPDPRYTRVGPFPEGHVVLRMSPTPKLDPLPAAASRELRELDRSAWQVQAVEPGAELAIDGDPSTAWTTGERPQYKGDFYRLVFPEPVVLARLSLSVSDPYEFPLVFKVVGEDPDGNAQDLPIDIEGAQQRLFAQLLRAPRTASLDLDLVPARRLSAVRVRITATDAYWMAWTQAEIRAYTSVP
jgi:hypothetical protein